MMLLTRLASERCLLSRLVAVNIFLTLFVIEVGCMQAASGPQYSLGGNIGSGNDPRTPDDDSDDTPSDNGPKQVLGDRPSQCPSSDGWVSSLEGRLVSSSGASFSNPGLIYIQACGDNREIGYVCFQGQMGLVESDGTFSYNVVPQDGNDFQLDASHPNCVSELHFRVLDMNMQHALFYFTLENFPNNASQLVFQDDLIMSEVFRDISAADNLTEADMEYANSIRPIDDFEMRIVGDDVVMSPATPQSVSQVDYLNFIGAAHYEPDEVFIDFGNLPDDIDGFFALGPGDTDFRTPMTMQFKPFDAEEGDTYDVYILGTQVYGFADNLPSEYTVPEGYWFNTGEGEVQEINDELWVSITGSPDNGGEGLTALSWVAYKKK